MKVINIGKYKKILKISVVLIVVLSISIFVMSKAFAMQGVLDLSLCAVMKALSICYF